MESDKELIRQGRYMEALGNNYVANAYYVMNFKNGRDKDPEMIKDRFFSKSEALDKIAELGIEDYMIGNLNADWL